jgi:splicing factor 3A subunit 3
VQQQHKISKHVNNITYYNGELERLYKDEDGKMAEEIQAMKGDTVFTSFYDKLQSTQEFYARYPDRVADSTPQLDSSVQVDFSGEEVFGKYLDLTDHHLRFCNVPGVGCKDLDYLQYLEKFNSFFYIPETAKRSKPYAAYVQELSNYLTNFFHRTQPLVDMGASVQEWRDAFEEKWSRGAIDGWKSSSSSGNADGGAQAQALRLGMYHAVEELEALGMARLKEALLAAKLKCGGTLQERAARLWSVRGKKWEDIPAKLKASSGHGAEGGAAAASQFAETAWLEYYVQSLSELMIDVVIATRRHAEKQQTRSVEEKAQERLEEEFGLLPDVSGDEGVAAAAGDDEDEPIYNPLNLPLGWDGKPIPYWMYKLHGLGVEYKCEICGNSSYWGRRAFDKHFQEWKHSHGMRCLGVPNTKHFHDITLIADALALYDKIKSTIKVDQFVQEQDEEFEDSEGNVLNKKIYEDLARQGLL